MVFFEVKFEWTDWWLGDSCSPLAWLRAALLQIWALPLNPPKNVTNTILEATYRVVQKNGTLFYFCDNFRKCAPIVTIFSLLEPEIYDA